MPLLQSEVGEARPAHALLGISGGDLDFSHCRAPLVFARGISGEDLDFFNRRAPWGFRVSTI